MEADAAMTTSRDRNPGHARAHAQARELLRARPRGSRLVVVHDIDADGTSSAALACAAAETLGLEPFAAAPRRGENVYAERFQAELTAATREAREGGALTMVVDTGGRDGARFAVEPVIVVDHHAAESGPVVDAFVSTRGKVDVVSSSLLTFELLEEVAELRERKWLAAIGLLGDLGDRAKLHPRFTEVTAGVRMTALRETVALVNAAGRASRHAPDVALAALREASSPSDVAGGLGAAARELATMREETSASFARARKVAPKKLGDYAVIMIDEPCRVHGLVAESWKRRLAPATVLVGNTGYSPGRVHFVVRAAERRDLRAALRALLPDAGPDFAAGHDQATGGIVDVATFERLLAAIAARGSAAQARVVTPSTSPRSRGRSRGTSAGRGP